MKISISALTQGIHVPSRRYRWAQHVDSLIKHDFDVHEYNANPSSYPPIGFFKRLRWLPNSLSSGFDRIARANHSDLIFLQRELTSTLITSEIFIKRPFVFDVDDAIFLHQRFGSVDKIASKADLTICGNDFLANHFSRFSDVVVIPTAVDSEHFFFNNDFECENVIIGWSGTSSGFKYLYEIEQAIYFVMRIMPEVYLKIVSDSMPLFQIIPNSRVIYTKWTPENEVGSLMDFSVGIMPVDNSLWALGKCSFKMLTYMSCRIPVVVSPVGMNNEVLGKGYCGLPASGNQDWIDALLFILKNRGIAKEMGCVGRDIVEKFYSEKIISNKLIDVFKSLS